MIKELPGNTQFSAPFSDTLFHCGSRRKDFFKPLYCIDLYFVCILWSSRRNSTKTCITITKLMQWSASHKHILRLFGNMIAWWCSLDDTVIALGSKVEGWRWGSNPQPCDYKSNAITAAPLSPIGLEWPILKSDFFKPSYFSFNLPI